MRKLQDGLKRGRLYALAATSVTGWVLSLHPRFGTFRLDGLPDRILLISPHGPEVIALWAISALLPAIVLVLLIRNRHRGIKADRSHVAAAWAVSLPLLVLATRLLNVTHPATASNILYYGAPALLTGLLLALLALHRTEENDNHDHRVPAAFWIAAILLLATLAHWASGVYFTESVGEHSGDEAHYLVQADSLRQDGDLDLRNNLSFATDKDRYHLHISPRSRDDKWYSWHPLGLSLLLAPTSGHGIGPRHAVLGLISGLGLAGFFMLALRLGATRHSAALASGLLGCSSLWVIYASRALPEILGAGLLTYAGLALLLVRERPWTAVFLASATAVALAWVQLRFLPVGLLTLGATCFAGLITWWKQPRQAVARLGTVVLLAISGYAAYAAMQFSLYEGGIAYPTGIVLLSNPEGIWHSIASNRGILYSFPLFSCGLAATLHRLLDHREGRLYALTALGALLAVLILTCATPWYRGGACLAGRFLLVIVPIMLAAVPAAWDRGGPAFKSLCLYLGLLSFTMLLPELMSLPKFVKAFPQLYFIDQFHPVFQDLVRPWDSPDAGTRLHPALTLIIGALILAAPAWRRFRSAWQGALTLLLALALVTPLALRPPQHPHQPRHSIAATAHILELCCDQSPWIRNHGRTTPLPLLEHSNRLHDTRIPIVTTRDLGKFADGNRLSYPWAPPNDWAGRGYRWVTLAPPFKAGRGPRALRLRGRMSGTVPGVFVVREGNHNHTERTLERNTPFDELLLFETHGNGDLYLLLRLEDGEGEFCVEDLSYSAYTKAILEHSGLSLPHG